MDNSTNTTENITMRVFKNDSNRNESNRNDSNRNDSKKNKNYRKTIHVTEKNGAYRCPLQHPSLKLNIPKINKQIKKKQGIKPESTSLWFYTKITLAILVFIIIYYYNTFNPFI